MVGINRNLTSRLDQVTPGKPMLDQVGNEPLLLQLGHLLPWAGLGRTCHNDFGGWPTDGQDADAPPTGADPSDTIPSQSWRQRSTDPHPGTLQFALGTHIGIVSAAPGGRESGDFNFPF